MNVQTANISYSNLWRMLMRKRIEPMPRTHNTNALATVTLWLFLGCVLFALMWIVTLVVFW